MHSDAPTGEEGDYNLQLKETLSHLEVFCQLHCICSLIFASITSPGKDMVKAVLVSKWNR